MFGAVELVKYADFDKCKYSGYGIGFDRYGTFSLANGFGGNVIIFGVAMNSSLHVDNKKGPIQGLDGTTLAAEKKNLINFTQSRKKFSLSFHFNGVNSYSLMASKFINSKQKTLKLMQFHYA